MDALNYAEETNQPITEETLEKSKHKMYKNLNKGLKRYVNFEK